MVSPQAKSYQQKVSLLTWRGAKHYLCHTMTLEDCYFGESVRCSVVMAVASGAGVHSRTVTERVFRSSGCYTATALDGDGDCDQAAPRERKWGLSLSPGLLSRM